MAQFGWHKQVSDRIKLANDKAVEIFVSGSHVSLSSKRRWFICSDLLGIRKDFEKIADVMKPSKTPGICRIDQPSHRTHGFFVRVHCRGKIHNGFFADKKHGGRAPAFAAAQKFHKKLLAKYGMMKPMPRRLWAQIRRRKGSSGMVGVQRAVSWKSGYKRVVWRATWSPRPGVTRRREFATRKHGAQKAHLLAIKARRTGLASMKD